MKYYPLLSADDQLLVSNVSAFLEMAVAAKERMPTASLVLKGFKGASIQDDLRKSASIKDSLSWLVAYVPGFRFKLDAFAGEKLENIIRHDNEDSDQGFRKEGALWLARNGRKIEQLYELLAEAEKNLTLQQSENIMDFYKECRIGSQRMPGGYNRN